MNILDKFYNDKDLDSFKIEAMEYVRANGVKPNRSPYALFTKVLKLVIEKKEIKLDDIEMIESLVRVLSPKLSSMDVRFTAMRKIFRKTFPEYKFKVDTTFKLEIEERNILINRSNTNLRRKMEFKTQLTTDDINNMISYLRKKSYDPTCNILILIVSTGRRLIEILRVSKKPKWNKETKLLTFTNQAKSRGMTEQPFDVPLLFLDPDEFFIRWKSVRSHTRHYDDLTNTELSSRFSGILKKELIEALPKIKQIARGSTHQLRKAYSQICCQRYKPKEMDRDLYIANILGHHGQNSVGNYCTLAVEEKIKDPVEEPVSKDADKPPLSYCTLSDLTQQFTEMQKALFNIQKILETAKLSMD